MEMIGTWLPDGLGVLQASVLIVASFFTSALTAAFGVGGGLAMLALMGMFIPVSAVIPVHGAVQIGSNSGRAWQLRAHVVKTIALPFIAGSIVGAFGGAFFVVQLPDWILKLVLGSFILAITWYKLPASLGLNQLGLAIGSIFLALLSMFVGATGPLVSAFFAQLLPNDRKALIATNAAGMSVQHGLKIVVFALAGFAFASWVPLILAMVTSGYLGTIHGTKYLERLPEEQFRRWFKIGLSVLALEMLRQGVLAYWS